MEFLIGKFAIADTSVESWELIWILCPASNREPVGVNSWQLRAELGKDKERQNIPDVSGLCKTTTSLSRQGNEKRTWLGTVKTSWGKKGPARLFWFQFWRVFCCWLNHLIIPLHSITFKLSTWSQGSLESVLSSVPLWNSASCRPSPICPYIAIKLNCREILFPIFSPGSFHISMTTKPPLR